jgi:hypothetical protein
LFNASLPYLVIIAGTLLLQACGTVPVEDAPAQPRVVPELTLNFPEQNANCVQQTVMDFTPLERGFTALAQGEHIEAVQHFQRYQRLEKSPLADLEAGIAIAYISILPASAFYDTEAARKSYRKLRKELTNEMQLHEQTLLMRQSLDTFLLMERNIVQLKKDNASLTVDLEKRERALKRLRELALGQKGER